MDKIILTIKKFFGKKHYKILPGDIFSAHMGNNEIIKLKCTRCIHSVDFHIGERFDLLEGKELKTKQMYVFCINYYLYPNENDDYKKSGFKIVDGDENDIF